MEAQALRNEGSHRAQGLGATATLANAMPSAMAAAAAPRRVLVLGGYGVFGSIIAERLAALSLLLPHAHAGSGLQVHPRASSWDGSAHQEPGSCSRISRPPPLLPPPSPHIVDRHTCRVDTFYANDGKLASRNVRLLASAFGAPSSRSAPACQWQTLIAGRSGQQAYNFAKELESRLVIAGLWHPPTPGGDGVPSGGSAAGAASVPPVVPISLDVSASVESLTDTLRRLHPDVVIDTVGPFTRDSPLLRERGGTADQFAVARACIAAGCHYIDIADDRDRVNCVADALHKDAAAAGVCVISGASTTPCISYAATTHLATQVAPPMATVTDVESVVSPGNHTPRGVATTASVLAYCGERFAVWRDGVWRDTFGWHSSGMRKVVMPHLRRARLVADMRVPDLSLFPHEMAPWGVRSVSFLAGLELWPLQLGIAAMAGGVKARLLESSWLVAAAETLKKLSDLWPLNVVGTDDGGMLTVVKGHKHRGRGSRRLDVADNLKRGAARRTWSLWAGSCDGPQVPSTPAVALAAQLLCGRTLMRDTVVASRDSIGAAATRTDPFPGGAAPCTGFLTLEEIEAHLRPFDVLFVRDGIDGEPLALGDGGRDDRDNGDDGDDRLDRAQRSSIACRGMGLQAFAALPEAVRQFHGVRGRVRGRMRVARGGGGAMASMAAMLGGMPPSGLCEVDVTCVPHPADTSCGAPELCWRRSYRDISTGKEHVMESRWSTKAGLVTEGFGPFTFGFQLIGDVRVPMRPRELDGSLAAVYGDEGTVGNGGGDVMGAAGDTVLAPAFAHAHKRMWCLGVPVPESVAMRPEGVTVPHADGRGWYVRVRVVHPWLGEVLTYEGHLRCAGDSDDA